MCTGKPKRNKNNRDGEGSETGKTMEKDKKKSKKKQKESSKHRSKKKKRDKSGRESHKSSSSDASTVAGEKSKNTGKDSITTLVSKGSSSTNKSIDTSTSASTISREGKDKNQNDSKSTSQQSKMKKATKITALLKNIRIQQPSFSNNNKKPTKSATVEDSNSKVDKGVKDSQNGQAITSQQQTPKAEIKKQRRRSSLLKPSLAPETAANESNQTQQMPEKDKIAIQKIHEQDPNAREILSQDHTLSCTSCSKMMGWFVLRQKYHKDRDERTGLTAVKEAQLKQLEEREQLKQQPKKKESPGKRSWVRSPNSRPTEPYGVPINGPKMAKHAPHPIQPDASSKAKDSILPKWTPVSEEEQKQENSEDPPQKSPKENQDTPKQ